MLIQTRVNLNSGHYGHCKLLLANHPRKSKVKPRPPFLILRPFPDGNGISSFDTPSQSDYSTCPLDKEFPNPSSMNDEDEEIQSRTPSPASSPLSGRISVPVVPPPESPPPRPPSSSPPSTPPSPPALESLTLALPAQQPRSSSGGGGSGGGVGGREDCWSETATEVLIDAWGERYLESSRGNLKQQHWQEVADLVNTRGGYSKVAKTDVQCKNRIDTVKKKYKMEKAKIGAGGVSSWPLFDKLDGLIGPTGKSPLLSVIKAVGATTSISGKKKKKKKRKRKVESDDDEEDDDDEDLGFDSDDGLPPPRKALPVVNREDVGNVEKGKDRSAVRVLTEAMLRFGEAYERAENAKLAHVVEMEKGRMRFAKEVELQRMQFFMKTQMEISQLKKRSSGSKHKQQPQQRRYHFHHHHRKHLDGNNGVVDKNASDDDV